MAQPIAWKVGRFLNFSFWVFHRADTHIRLKWKGSSVIQSPECQELSVSVSVTPFITLKGSETQNVDLGNKVGGNHYLRHTDHRPELHWHEQDRIFQMDVRTRNPKVKHNEFERQPTFWEVLEVQWRPQWGRILFVRYECSGLESVPNITYSSKNPREDTFSVDHHRRNSPILVHNEITSMTLYHIWKILYQRSFATWYKYFCGTTFFWLTNGIWKIFIGNIPRHRFFVEYSFFFFNCTGWSPFMNRGDSPCGKS